MKELEDIEQLLRSTLISIDRAREENARRLTKTKERLAAFDGDPSERFEKRLSEKDLAEILREVREAIQRGDLASVRRRHLRLALRSFQKLTVTELEAIVDHAPTLWPVLVRRVFEQRPLGDGEARRPVMNLLRRAPKEVELLHSPLFDREALLNVNGFWSAQTLARRFPPTTTLEELLQKLTGPTLLDARWGYTALVLANCFAANGRNLQSAWAEITRNQRLEAMLLPPRDELGRSLFGGGGVLLPTGERPVEAQAVVAMALLCQKQRTREMVDAWKEVFFQATSFGDPRVARSPRERPSKTGWQWVKRLDEKAYGAFISALLAEDISLFFGSGKMNKDRRDFWSRYTGTAWSSEFFLSADTRKGLEEKYQGADQKVLAALNRARTLVDANGVDAFALRFENHVIVEFSKTGHAAYFHDGNTFDTVIDAAKKDALRPKELKDKNRKNQYPHTPPSPGWENRFEQELMKRGIYPSPEEDDDKRP